MHTHIGCVCGCGCRRVHTPLGPRVWGCEGVIVADNVPQFLGCTDSQSKHYNYDSHDSHDKVNRSQLPEFPLLTAALGCTLS